MRKLTFTLIVAFGCTHDLSLPGPLGAGSLSGRIVYALPGSSDRLPAAGAQVQLLGSSVATTTGEQGFFRLDGILVNQGSVLVRFTDTATGVQRQRILELSELGVAPGRQVSIGDLTVAENARVHGRVRGADHVSLDGGHKGTAVFVPASPFATFTADDGSFTLSQLPSGTLRVSFYRDGYLARTLDGVALRPGEDFSLGDVLLAADLTASTSTGSIAGRAALSPALSDGTGTTVTARSLATGSAAPAVATGLDGSFTASALVAGLYAVTLTHDSYSSAVVGNVLVSRGATTQLGDIVVSKNGGSLQGETQAGGDGGTATDAGTPGSFPPNAVATAAPVRAGAVGMLDGSSSISPDGKSDDLLFAWTQDPSDPFHVTLSSNGTVLSRTPTFEAPNATVTLHFSLVVTGHAGQSAPAKTDVLVFQPPVAVVNAPLQVRPGSTVLLDGSQSFDPNHQSLKYDWSSPDQSVQITSTKETALFTAPKSQNTAITVQLIVRNAANSVVASDPLLLVMQVSPQAPLVAAVSVHPAQQQVFVNSAVHLNAKAASGDSSETFSYFWSFTSQEAQPIQLVGAQTANAAFTAPATYAKLQFAVTAQGSNGSLGRALATVEVQDNIPPHLVATDPLDGGVGSWLSATATFDKALDPLTVTSGNMTIVDADGGTVATDLKYDGPTRMVKMLPRIPLGLGKAYALKIGAVRDLSPARNAHATELVNFVARAPLFAEWMSTDSISPNPAIAIAPSEGMLVLGRFPCNSNGAGPSTGTCAWTQSAFQQTTTGTTTTNQDVRPQTMADQGTLASPLIDTSCQAQETKKAVTVGGDIYWMASEQCSLPSVLLKRAFGSWTPMDAQPESIFTDGTTLFGFTSAWDFKTYDPLGDRWFAETVIHIPSPYGYDAVVESGASDGTRIVGAASAVCNGDVCPTGHYLQVYERTAPATWTHLGGAVIAGGDSYFTGAVASSDGGPIVSRTMFAQHEPFLVFAEDVGGPQISGAAWNSRQGKWTTFPNLSGGPSIAFDAAARGDTVYIAFVRGTSLLMRRLDLTAPTPVPKDIFGPSGAPAFNFNVDCQADHPQLTFSDDGLFMSWQENCPGSFLVGLVKLY